MVVNQTKLRLIAECENEAFQVTDSREEQEPAQHVSRREDRSPTNWIATIRLRDGTEIPCNVKDVSKSGAKIGVPANQVLPPVFMLRIIGRDFLCLVKLAWRRGDYAGVRIEKIGKVPAPVPISEEAETNATLDTPPHGGVRVPSRKRAISAF